MLVAISLSGSGCSQKQQLVRQTPPKPEAVQPQPRSAPQITTLERWYLLVEQQRTAPELDKIVAVNTFFNGFDIVDDRYWWGEEDYWATLFETLATSGGDCEDFSIAKYFTLRRLNIPDERLRLTYVISLKTKKPHMVLTCSLPAKNEPLVLDTAEPEVLPVSGRSDLVPVYSFNSGGYWLARREKNWQGGLGF